MSIDITKKIIELGKVAKANRNNKSKSFTITHKGQNHNAKVNWDMILLDTENDEFSEIENIAIEFNKKWISDNSYLRDVDNLKSALDQLELFYRDYGAIGKTGFKYYLMSKLDQADPEVKAKTNELYQFEVKIMNLLEFFTIRLSKISKEQQLLFLTSPILLPYKHFLEVLFKQAEHILSEPEEKIFNELADTSWSRWNQMIEEILSAQQRFVIDVDGRRHRKNFEQLLSSLSSKNTVLRASAKAALDKCFDEIRKPAEYDINSILQTKSVSDRLRGYQNPDDASILSEDIDRETIDTLVNTVAGDYNTSHRFYALKAKVMGQKKINYYERTIDLSAKNKKYTLKEAYQIVDKTFSILDREFADILHEMFINGQYDVFPKQNKSGGAFCTSAQKSFPIYVLLNFEGRVRDITTIAHETGHAINNVLMRRQNALNYGNSLAVAEFASTFMEDFVFDEIIKNTPAEKRLPLIMNKLDDQIGSVYRQIACYQFELDLHNEYRNTRFVSSDRIGKLFVKNMINYLGDAVIVRGQAEDWWIHWSHIRRPFYVFSYASGLLIAKALQRKYKSDKSIIEEVKEILSSGTNDTPANIFAKVGININSRGFWQEGLDEISDLITQAEKLAK